MNSGATRLPWPADFPDVVVHTTVPGRDSHRAHASAKAGDPEAALTLASDLLDSRSVELLQLIIGAREALLLPVIADETLGFDAIPDAMAQVLGHDLDLPVIAGEIVQTNEVGHTRAPAFQRLVTPAVSDGAVQTGAAYVPVDDHVGLWRAQFGHKIDCLTEVEALQLCRQPSVAGIEDSLAKAAIEARGRGLAPAV